MNPILFLQIITSIYQAIQAINNTLMPLVALIGTTHLEFMTANGVVIAGWNTMTAVADGVLGLLVVIKVIQMMYGQTTGTLYTSPGQFIPKVILTVILMHLSFLIGQDLLILNQTLCDLIHANVAAFLQQVNGGQAFNVGQQLGVAIILAIVFTLSMIRIIFQAVKRIIFFDVLFILSAPAFLMSFDAQTSPWFSFWARTYVVTVFTQFFQLLTFSLGMQFLVVSKQTGILGFFLAVVMLNFTAEIPGILSRFSATAGANTAGIGTLVRSAITAAALFI